VKMSMDLKNGFLKSSGRRNNKTHGSELTK